MTTKVIIPAMLTYSVVCGLLDCGSKVYHCPTEDELEVLRDHVAHGHIGDQVAVAVNPVFSPLCWVFSGQKGWMDRREKWG